MHWPALETSPRRGTFIWFALAAVLSVGPVQAQQPDSEQAVMTVPGGKIEITLPDAPLKVSRQELLDWVKSASDAVSHYYGRFPASHLDLVIHTDHNRGIHHGSTYPRSGGFIRVTVGDQATVANLNDDWVLTHEMIHLAFPSMADNHHWIEEGISTYVEPVARAQVGNLTVAEVWKQFIRDMPKGQPALGDQGLDNTPTWGRTYWGGAMFCLLADVEIREQTKNRKGLRDALRAILNAGGNITEDWEIDKALAIGDKATGTDVLKNLYHRMRDKPAPAELDELWKKLGVKLTGDGVEFNDKAPDAAIRQAITAK
jgi:hypothetical protein